jgi:hypothetical protein
MKRSKHNKQDALEEEEGEEEKSEGYRYHRSL